MPGPIDVLPETHSPLGRIDARWKLAGMLAAILATLVLRTLPMTLLALSFATGLAWVGRLPRRWCRVRIGTVLVMVAPFMILLPLLSPEGPHWELGPVSVSGAGAAAALVLGCKSAGIVLLILVLLATAPMADTLKAAQSLRIPGLFVQLAVLTYRYIFVLLGELNRIRVALRVRAYRNRPNLHCYRTIGNVAGTLLVRGYEQAEHVDQAMRSRGFNGRFRSLTSFQTRWHDVAACALIIVTALALVAGDWLVQSFAP